MPKTKTKTEKAEVITAEDTIYPDLSPAAPPAVASAESWNPEQPAGKKETRLFQQSPDKKEWLTKEEAVARGFHWAD